MKFHWELLDNNDGETYRAKVFGGWVLLRKKMNHVDSHEQMIFIPDHKHDWDINEDEIFLDPTMNLPLHELELTTRPYKALKFLGVETIGQLCQMTRKELEVTPNIGRHAVNEVIEALSNHGLKLALKRRQL